MSLASRLTRALELRVDDVQLDAKAQLFIRDCARRTIRLVANEPDERDRADLVGQGGGIPLGTEEWRPEISVVQTGLQLAVEAAA